jgi:hypothetical protein
MATGVSRRRTGGFLSQPGICSETSTFGKSLYRRQSHRSIFCFTEAEMFCPHCGNEILSERVRFCTRCSFPLTTVKELVEAEAAKSKAEEGKKNCPLRWRILSALEARGTLAGGGAKRNHRIPHNRSTRPERAPDPACFCREFWSGVPAGTRKIPIGLSRRLRSGSATG